MYVHVHCIILFSVHHVRTLQYLTQGTGSQAKRLKTKRHTGQNVPRIKRPKDKMSHGTKRPKGQNVYTSTYVQNKYKVFKNTFFLMLHRKWTTYFRKWASHVHPVYDRVIVRMSGRVLEV